MWIQELIIKNFGKFSDKRIILHPGINLIYGENESGKSTLHAFIRGCLYGMRKMRGRASKTDVYSRYQPWEHPSYYAGAMRFSCGGKVFRLERDFTKGIQSGILICETDGERLSLERGDLEVLLGNVGEVTFDNTVSVGQLKSETDEGLAVELKNYMANMEGTGNSSIRVEKALILLKEEKKRLEKKRTAIREKEEERMLLLKNRIRFLMGEIEKEKIELKKARLQLAQYADANRREEVKAGFFQRFFRWIKRLIRRFFGNRFSEENNMEEAKLLGKIEHLESLIHEKELLIENGRQDIQLQNELYQSDEDANLVQEIEACSLAMMRIQEVVSKMQGSVGRFLKERTSEIFSELTDHKYHWVEVQKDLTLGVHGRDHFIPVEQLSRGTIWQLYFALRMAANEVLCQEENLPVILDDAFVMYDGERLGKVLSWLARQKKQVLIFTCQKREKEWMEEKGILFHEITL